MTNKKQFNFNKSKHAAHMTLIREHVRINIYIKALKQIYPEISSSEINQVKIINSHFDHNDYDFN